MASPWSPSPRPPSEGAAGTGDGRGSEAERADEGEEAEEESEDEGENELGDGMVDEQQPYSSDGVQMEREGLPEEDLGDSEGDQAFLPRGCGNAPNVSADAADMADAAAERHRIRLAAEVTYQPATSSHEVSLAWHLILLQHAHLPSVLFRALLHLHCVL